MRASIQIEVDGDRLFALCKDGTIWVKHRKSESEQLADEWSDWEFIEGPPEGNPATKKPTLEEQAENLRVKGGSQTFVGRGHHLHEGKD